MPYDPGMSSDDELAIREVMATWMAATGTGDAATVLDLMTDDAVFQTPGAEPFGKQAFADAAAGRPTMDIDAAGEVLEVKVLGDWAYMRAHLTMTVTMPDGDSMRRSGNTLSILVKGTDGRWRISRDANLVTADD